MVVRKINDCLIEGLNLEFGERQCSSSREKRKRKHFQVSSHLSRILAVITATTKMLAFDGLQRAFTHVIPICPPVSHLPPPLNENRLPEEGLEGIQLPEEGLEDMCSVEDPAGTQQCWQRA